MVEAIAAAATRYLEKYSRPAEMLESVVDVSEGRLQLPEEAMKRVLTMSGTSVCACRTGL